MNKFCCSEQQKKRYLRGEMGINEDFGNDEGASLN